MGFTGIQTVLWAVGSAALAILFGVLLIRHRIRQFPCFAALVGFDALQNLALPLFFSAKAHLYQELYWGGQAIEFFLQLAVVVEIARHVFKPFGRWAAGARSFWIAASALCLVLALGMAFLAQPAGASSGWSWVLRGDLFAVMLTCTVSVAVLITARRYGLSWRNHVMGLAQGWTFSAFITFVVETCHSYWGYKSMYLYLALFYIGAFAGIIAQLYWMFVFWRNEPVRDMTPEMHQILVERQRELDYYVAKLVHRTQSRRTP